MCPSVWGTKGGGEHEEKDAGCAAYSDPKSAHNCKKHINNDDDDVLHFGVCGRGSRRTLSEAGEGEELH